MKKLSLFISENDGFLCKPIISIAEEYYTHHLLHYDNVSSDRLELSKKLVEFEAPYKREKGKQVTRPFNWETKGNEI